jgi:signal transduction histidine kinase/CheY-like chemotaxis protein
MTPVESFRSLPLHKRLRMLIALCAGLTALLSTLAVVGTGWWLQEGRAREESTEVARTLSYALQAAVAFDDRRGMADAVGILRGRPQTSDAWVYDPAGRLLFNYGNGVPVEPGTQGGSLWAGQLIASEPVRVDGRVVGSVTIVNRVSHLWQALLTALVAIAACSGVAFGVSVWLAHRLARGITEPIARLAQASSTIAASHDYDTKLPAGGSDEVGTAVAAFNGMIDEIRSRGDALQEANRVLEQRVVERTQALQLEKERAEAASVAKTRFLANMSHELRTPLNAVIGAAQLLKQERGVVDREAHLVEAIGSGGTKLLAQIENILDLARIEAGALELAPEDFNLLDCVDAAVATAAVQSRAKGLELASVVDARVAAWRHGDPMRLRQVLLNLLGNAVKFTLQGEVVLRVEPGDGPDGLRIRVTDTGIGISQTALAEVFEPFRQADDATSRRFGGSGLGLAISRQLVEAMHGQLSVRSELGQGSCFELTLDLPPVAPPAADTPLGHTVIFFEPHEASAEALSSLLARIGCSARRCRTPRELREWMEAHATDPVKPWLLAAVDAEETWAFLEDSIAWLDPERVIGMSTRESHEAETAREHFRVPRNVIKPVLRSALVSRFGAVARAAPAPVRPIALMTAQEYAGLRRILVVEDDLTNQTIVCGMLENAGYLTHTAGDGASALEILAHGPFDLVLMDWQMPDMDGLEVTRRLRSGAVGRIGKVVPIVALTANAFAEDRAACLAAGMNDFLTKPVLASALHATVARWIGAAEHDPSASHRLPD